VSPRRRAPRMMKAVVTASITLVRNDGDLKDLARGVY
jgi:hypothetical protein